MERRDELFEEWLAQTFPEIQPRAFRNMLEYYDHRSKLRAAFNAGYRRTNSKPDFEETTDDELADAFVETLRASVYLGRDATISTLRDRTGLDYITQQIVLRAAREMGVASSAQALRKIADPQATARIQRVKRIMDARGWPIGVRMP